MKFYSVLDVKVESYSAPFAAANDAQAFRSFEQAIQDPQTTLSKYPEDFTLWRIGEFAEETGRLIPENPVQIARALDFIMPHTQEIKSA